MRQILLAALLPLLAKAQQAGTLQQEVHPKLTWKRCTGDACETVQGEITLDAEDRWLHVTDGFSNCFDNRQWRTDQCNSTESCTQRCALEGVDYPSFGIKTNGDTLLQEHDTRHAFGRIENTRVFLMEKGTERYQTFTLLGNELAFDVDLSKVPCGLNSALHFVAMDADGGSSKFPGNKAGAKYGTGYCDASCPRSIRFVGGKANFDGWQPSYYDPNRGQGFLGACCPEFDVWNSNSNSFQMSSKLCRQTSYSICQGDNCEGGQRFPDCDRDGCDYNPYRLGAKDFYGLAKTVDTSKKFTVVTQFAEDKVTKFFIQDGQKIDAPATTLPGAADSSGLNADYCLKKSQYFGEHDMFNVLGGYRRHNDVLRQPLVMALSIQNDYYAANLWLDSRYPLDSWAPGTERGPCEFSGNVPGVPEVGDNKVSWSNIRFGPIGSTTDV
ncbi:exoglucanase 1 precursor [Colletotrichum truncatum]|uniref:Exoglucanase 1 n=1 Tax=Colletotrichum truncatum TaxID=5467 RepID=A0ACC3YU55_COLTU|nr:exoglucanase 1 precursor [Colletotrichum truncatum]KAF6782173.1 exoglucanase 1 precursor [Colletotrichum truncatum]